MLQIVDLTKRFGTTAAVDGVSIDIAEGAMVGIIGRSGAGKSTLLRMINRLADPTSGRILAGDVDVASLKGPALLKLRQQRRPRPGLCLSDPRLNRPTGHADLVDQVAVGRDIRVV